MDKPKALQFVKNFTSMTTAYGHQFDFKLGICYIILRNYEKAQMFFDTCALSMFTHPKFWEDSGQPNRLIDIFILSKQRDLLDDIVRELIAYKSNRYGRSYVACYSYAVADLLISPQKDISTEIVYLLKNPKIKIATALGYSLQAIIENDQISFGFALESILAIHKGQATHGALRETPEGWLCMPAMTLIYLAMKQNFQININSEYLDAGYIKYLYG
jgi:hypothetical protein